MGTMTVTSDIFRAGTAAAPRHGVVPRQRSKPVDYLVPVERSAAVTRPSLSDREVEVLLAWLAAESKEDAAARLFISASTVSTHLARIRAKYTAVGRSAPTKTHLFARALQDGYTGLDQW
ncbi:helix-turn-helix transcriptional regulator [Gordonia sp. WA4-43]|nr:LuxR C-terminal-related transcriptional regulator [Gordonia sp. WA4-43]UCZ91764.1 helix-turn-helix transcriptional regulator [Gordonia sp. WA4-43]